MLAEKMDKHAVDCWLVNTGWVGGKFGTGSRCPLKYTRAIINAIHDGTLAQSEYETYDVFGLQIPKACHAVPVNVLDPKKAWGNAEAFEKERKRLANMFVKAFRGFEDQVDDVVKDAGPNSTID